MRTIHLLLVVVWGLSPRLVFSAPEFGRDVLPLLQKHCIACHGPDKQRAGLRLDSLKALKEGGNSGTAIDTANVKNSVLIKALQGVDGYAVMPPEKPRLTTDQIMLIREWISTGAKGDDRGSVVQGAGPRSQHWAFQPPKRVAPPLVQNRAWVRNPIDAFILARLEQAQISPSPEANRVTLIRRLCFDLTGLPPTPEQVDRFVQDAAPDAYERLVDQLLDSPHYGERWGRHWLDVARYADTNGYSIDAPRSIWKYRDWVINAINADMPFDRFTAEQLAGDLLPQPTTEQLTATGFHRNTQINQEGGIDLEQFRVESIIDRTNTTGSVWMGLTVGCAQCHDHKYDPISQREYYQFYAFFNTVDEPNVEIVSPSQQRRRDAIRAQLADIETRLKRLDPTSTASLEAWERSLSDASRETLTPQLRDLFLVAPNGRSVKQIAILENANRQNDEVRHAVGGLMQSPLIGIAHQHLLMRRHTLIAERERLRKAEPPTTTTMVVRERKGGRKTNLFLGGDFLRQGVEVQPLTPAVLPPLSSTKPTRLDLARWMTQPDHPLTGRVAVNRYWEKFFGLGLVETDNDFGTQGTPPTHAALLDYLATEYPRLGWSMKQLHRLMVTSATYRQGSHGRADLMQIDARNRLLARQNRFRLDAEIVRDNALSVSGLLSRHVGGPSVYPPQPDGVYNFTQVKREWKTAEDGDRYRRGMYTYFQRSAAHPGLILFDAPDATTTCTRRNRSNTPLQALTLLNDDGFVEMARAFAQRITHETPTMSPREQLRHGFRLALAREPNARELDRLQAFLDAQLQAKPETAWWMTARVLLNLDEFMTRE